MDRPFILEPYKGKASRYTCPNCQNHRIFARYIYTDTGHHLSPYAGRCNREDSCGYHYTPKQHFEDNPDQAMSDLIPNRQKPLPAIKQISFVTPDVFKASLHGYGGNYFVSYLQKLFGPDVTSQLISRYFIGTSKYWQGATVFYQIDTKGRIRAGKVMLYSPKNGKRVKTPYDHITWAHSALQLQNYHLHQCFFGEHLLQAEPDKPVAIVESEKTAIIASAYLTEFVWIAAGNKNGLNLDKCQVLRGRRVVLYPDMKAFDDWSAKAKELSSIAAFTVSDLLERKACDTDLAKGLDLADYLTQLDYRQFIKPTAPEKPALTTEFYHFSFDELIAAVGYDKAVAKAKHYQELSRQYRACKTFVVHTSRLLTTYHNISLKQAS